VRRARLHAADGTVARMLDLAPAPHPAPRVILTTGGQVYITHEVQTDPARVMVYVETAAMRVAS
jgi:hypothetical protein